MTACHVIRLRGPWEYEPLERADPSGVGEVPRVHLPLGEGESLPEAIHGRMRFRRWFNQPRQLDEHEQVWIVIEGLTQPAEVRLNDQPLGCIEANIRLAQFEITTHLERRNRLTFDMTLPLEGPINAPWSDVRLEICGS